MRIITGYKLETQNVNDIEMLLNEIQKAVSKRATEEYHQLLCDEIETMIDDIALNVYDRPNVAILDAAQNLLNQKIAYASGKGLPTAYNLHVSAHVMFSGEDSFIRIISNNNIYNKQISSIKGLQPYSLESESSSQDQERSAVWEKLMGKYDQGVQPLAVNIFPCGEIQVEKSMLKFRSPAKRADVRARHTLQNRYLGMYANDAEIPNYMLMGLLDQALKAVTSSTLCKAEMRKMKQELQAILPNITYALISETPTESVIESKDGPK